MSGSGRGDTGHGGDCGGADARTSPAWSPAVTLLHGHTALAGWIGIILPLQSLGMAPARLPKAPFMATLLLR